MSATPAIDPGVAKTRAVKALARKLDAQFRRIQFTPDLLPSGVAGCQIHEQKSAAFRLEPSPAFGNIVLVDEINRAPATDERAILRLVRGRNRRSTASPPRRRRVSPPMRRSNAWLGWRPWRRCRTNAYRRAALRGAETAAILKRTALAAWPREAVASLSGQDWAAILQRTAPGRSWTEHRPRRRRRSPMPDGGANARASRALDQVP